MSLACLVSFDLHGCPWYNKCYAPMSKYIARPCFLENMFALSLTFLGRSTDTVQGRLEKLDRIGPMAANRWTVRKRISTLSPGKPFVRPKVRVTASMEMFGSCDQILLIIFHVFKYVQMQSSQDFFAMFPGCICILFTRNVQSWYCVREFSVDSVAEKLWETVSFSWTRALPHHDQAIYIIYPDDIRWPC